MSDASFLNLIALCCFMLCNGISIGLFTEKDTAEVVRFTVLSIAIITFIGSLICRF